MATGDAARWPGRPRDGPAAGSARRRSALVRMPREMPRMMRAHCEVGGPARRAAWACPDHVRGSLRSMSDGTARVARDRLRGTACTARGAASRQVARDLDTQRTIARRRCRRRGAAARGPDALSTRDLVDAPCLELEPDNGTSAWEAMLAAEPEAPLVMLDRRSEIDTRAAACLGRSPRLISPYLRGHSAAVSTLAAHGRSRLGLPRRRGAARATSRRSCTIVGWVTRCRSRLWERVGPLDPMTGSGCGCTLITRGRVFAQAAVAARDRGDGGGAPRALRRQRLSPGATAGGAAAGVRPGCSAATDAYCAMTRGTSHTVPPLRAADACRRSSRADAAAGRLDGAGRRHRPRRRAAALRTGAAPAPTLTAREIEVLRLLARGARRTSRSRARWASRAKTVDNHVQRIYAKARGDSTRAAADGVGDATRPARLSAMGCSPYGRGGLVGGASWTGNEAGSRRRLARFEEERDMTDNLAALLDRMFDEVINAGSSSAMSSTSSSPRTSSSHGPTGRR